MNASFTAKVLTTSTSYGYDGERHQYEVEVKMGGNVIGLYDGEDNWEEAFDWAVYAIDWIGKGERAGYADSVNIGHDHAYNIADAVVQAITR